MTKNWRAEMRDKTKSVGQTGVRDLIGELGIIQRQTGAGHYRGGTNVPPFPILIIACVFFESF